MFNVTRTYRFYRCKLTTVAAATFEAMSNLRLEVRSTHAERKREGERLRTEKRVNRGCTGATWEVLSDPPPETADAPLGAKRGKGTAAGQARVQHEARGAEESACFTSFPCTSTPTVCKSAPRCSDSVSIKRSIENVAACPDASL